MSDIVRVLRVYEFIGPRDLVEQQVSRSLKGTKILPNGMAIRSATVGDYPEILADMSNPMSIAETVQKHKDPVSGEFNYDLIARDLILGGIL